MKATMIYDRILVRVIPTEGKTKGGLYVPAQVHENASQWRGEVLEVGHGRISDKGEVIKLRVKQGDVVIFVRAPQSGEQAALSLDDEKGMPEDLLIIREPHVLAILTGLPRATGLVGLDGKAAVINEPS